ncbi:MAG: hypothetical protein R2867_38510 [Caldilineaceae bacterium]
MRELDYLLRRLDDLDQLLKMERNHLQNGQAMPDMPQVVLADIGKPLPLSSSNARHWRRPSRHIASAIRNCKRFTANSWASPASVSNRFYR